MTPRRMRAWVVQTPGPIESEPLRLTDKEVPEPEGQEVLVKVLTCGVCRTDLHVAEGDLEVHKPGVTPGHEIVGRVVASGPDASNFVEGDRIGIAWLRHTCGVCRFCARDDENLCVSPLFTGWDADGGYAEFAVIDKDYAYPIPDGLDDASAAPLLCAGIIGFRALRRSGLGPGERLGIYGFGASAHLAAQVALYWDARVHVMTRSEDAQKLALSLGCTSAQGAVDPPPEPLDAAIIFAPAGELVPPALEALDRGGVVATAGIHMSDIPSLDYAKQLFEEKELRSVTANTRQDGRDFLDLAERIPVRAETVEYPFEQADRALADLAADRVSGAAVLRL